MVPNPFLVALVRARIPASEVRERDWPSNITHQQALVYLRRFCGYTEVELSEQLGISTSRISEVENKPGCLLSASNLTACVRLAKEYDRPKLADYFKRQQILAQAKSGRQGGRR